MRFAPRTFASSNLEGIAGHRFANLDSEDAHRRPPRRLAIPSHVHGQLVRQGSASGTLDDLVSTLERLCRSEWFRAEDRAFVKDVERILVLLRDKSTGESKPSRVLPRTSTVEDAPSLIDQAERISAPVTAAEKQSVQARDHETSSDAEVDAQKCDQADIRSLVNCVVDLFGHRYDKVRHLAFSIVNVCLEEHGAALGEACQCKILRRLDTHRLGDFLLRQKTFYLLISYAGQLDGLRCGIHSFMLRLLEESDEQEDLLELIQTVFRDRPDALDLETVDTIASVVCNRCDYAWSQGDIDSCRAYLPFFHTLVSQSSLAGVVSGSTCLRTLSCLVNADGHGTWSIVRTLLEGPHGFQALRCLVSLLENPTTNTQWTLRGAVFFVGMSCWGSQRVKQLGSIRWIPILMSLEKVLQCNYGVVIFEVILAIQRLIKKFGDAKNVGSNETDRRLLVEWDVILRVFEELRPWLSPTEDAGDDDSDSDDGDSDSQSNSSQHSAKTQIASPSDSYSVSVRQTRIPRELLDTLAVVEELVVTNRFSGDVDDFYNVLELYMPHLPEASVLQLLQHRAEASHPAYNSDWLRTLRDTLDTFFSDTSMATSVRAMALEMLQLNLWTSRNVCEDRVVEEVVLPVLSRVYDDIQPEIRHRGIAFLTEIARHLESVKFDAVLDIVANAVTLSHYDNSQEEAIACIVSLFSSHFNHLPHSRSLRMYEIITRTVESHRNWRVRQTALECLLHVCEANAEFQLLWKDNQLRTSRFLYCSKKAVRNARTGAYVPVCHGLRALLTLVNTETHAGLFRMAVTGIQRMLENRVILTDVDISEMTLKLISSVDYRAFGRAAIQDEISTSLRQLLHVESLPSIPDEDTKEGRARSYTDPTALLELIDATPDEPREGEAPKFDVRETVARSCKAKFMHMAMNVLGLLVSYTEALNKNAREHLVHCLLGVMGTPLLVSDHDLATATERSNGMQKSRSEEAMHEDEDPASKTLPAPLSSSFQSSLPSYGSTTQNSRRSSPALFASRVFSHFQSNSSQKRSRDVNASSLSTSKVSTANNKDQLRQVLRTLYEAEVQVLRSACNSLTLLSLRISDVVMAAMDALISSVTGCFRLKDGAFRADAYRVALELVANVVASVGYLSLDRCKLILHVALVGIQKEQSKDLTSLGFRVIGQIITKAPFVDRPVLASEALPTLREHSNSLITQAAIDFLMCFAYSQSNMYPTALRLQHSREKETIRSSASYVHNSAVMTIDMLDRRRARVTVRRPSCTSSWEMEVSSNYCLDPAAQVGYAGRTQPSSSAKRWVDEFVRTKVSEFQVDASVTSKCTDSTTDMLDTPTPRARTRASSTSSDRSKDGTVLNKVVEGSPVIRSDSSIVASSSRGSGSGRQSSKPKAWKSPPPAALPPLPAYDGHGGSPCYFFQPSPDEEDKKDGARVIKAHSSRRMDNTSPLDLSMSKDLERHVSALSLDATALETLFPTKEDASVSKEGTAVEVEKEWFDPSYVMMQLLDYSSDSRPQLLSSGEPLELALKVLDRTPAYETHKIGVLYMRDGNYKSERALLSTFGGSMKYLSFLRGLGTFTRLRDTQDYTGGLDTVEDSDGQFGLLYKNECLQMMFHVATLMVPKEGEDGSMMSSFLKKKRHIGNDMVHVVFKECDEEYALETLSGHFNDVHIIVQPLNDDDYRVQVHAKDGITPFGPLHGTQIVASACVAESVRLTCLNANLACQAYHQDLMGFSPNYEDRLKQIKQLSMRLATTEAWDCS